MNRFDARPRRHSRCSSIACVLAVLAACSRDAAPIHRDVPASAAPSAAPTGEEVRYLALGDSFTAGTGARPDQAFPARLVARWRARGMNVVLKNVAVNGYTTQDLIDRELPELEPFHPNFVTLAIGANDIVHGSTPEQYRAQVHTILAAIARAVPAGRIVALPQPDWSLSPAAKAFGKQASVASSIETFNGILRDEAAAMGARYVAELFPRMRAEAARGWIASDGLHPSAPAYDEWADVLAKEL